MEGMEVMQGGCVSVFFWPSLADEVPWKNPHSWVSACLLTQETMKAEGKVLS